MGKRELLSIWFRKRLLSLPVFMIVSLGAFLVAPVDLPGDEKPVPGVPRFTVGQEVPPETLAGAVSLSAGKNLALDDTYYLFFSNVPEMPTEPGILCRVDDVLSPSGMVRVLFSHMNLLIDWTRRPLANVPATAGFAVENHTGRKLDVYAVRGALEASRAPDGTHLFLEDAAPVRPGDTEPLYFGTAVGNYMVQQWFLSENRPPVLLGSMPPGGRVVVSGDVGPRGWITGMYDLKFVDSATGSQVAKGDLAAGESVGIKTFLAHLGADLDSFLDRETGKGAVQPPRKNDLKHMRGLFIPGSYPDNPPGEAVSKRFTVYYAAAGGRAASFALAAGESDQGEDPEKPGYVADVFLNDRLRNGFDPFAGGIRGVNGGNYGVDYTIDLCLAGPVALVLQGALGDETPTQEAFIDLHNQILTYRLDGVVRTIFLRDPNYDQFYANFSLLRPHGYGRVIAVYQEQGYHRHTLRFTLPPNSYGPVRFYLLPL
ncbi:MAG: hypothetical protein K6T66_06750 [Peptococcaceae bacterium]|nr:hypothetical protein [Peptococcaceae bacterium]